VQFAPLLPLVNGFVQALLNVVWYWRFQPVDPLGAVALQSQIELKVTFPY
jgi:hypothetical protein